LEKKHEFLERGVSEFKDLSCAADHSALGNTMCEPTVDMSQKWMVKMSKKKRTVASVCN